MNQYSFLIIDDNPNDIELMRLTLRDLKPESEVRAVFDGETALKSLRNERPLPHLIFLDIKMPGMTGIETLREIRSDASLMDIPVAVVTSSSLESDKEEAYIAGANAYLYKAFNISQFAKDIKSVLERLLKQDIH